MQPEEVPLCGSLSPAFVPACEALRSEVQSRKLLGVQVYVSLRARRLLDVGLGWSRRGRAMVPTDISHWLCCTKPLVALLLARLGEREGLDPSSPVRRYLEEFVGERRDQVTVAQLLTHTSGLAGDPALDYALCAWDRMIAAATSAEVEVGWDPSRRARYVDFTTWALLAEMVRRKTGWSVGRAMKEIVFDGAGLGESRLGMTTAEWDAYGDRLSRLHGGVAGGPRECAFLNWREAAHYEWPAFGARGPASELGRIFEALLGFGPRLVADETLARFTAPVREGVLDETWGDNTAWGLGFIADPGFFGLPSNAGHAFGHTGLGSSFVLAVPRWGLVVVCVSNVISSPQAHRTRIRRVVGSLVDGLRGVGELA